MIEPGVFEIRENGVAEITIIPGGYEWDNAYTYYFNYFQSIQYYFGCQAKVF